MSNVGEAQDEEPQDLPDDSQAELNVARALRERAKARGSESEEHPPPISADKQPNTSSDEDGESDPPDNRFEDDSSTASALAAVQLRRQQAQVDNQEQNLNLRKTIARWAMWAVSLQLVVSAVAFFIYLIANINDADSNVIITWLGATVVEVVGIAAVVTRNLFPPRKTNDENGDIT